MRRQLRVIGWGCALAVAGLGAGIQAQNALADLGVKEVAAREQIVDALASGYVPVYSASRAFKAATPAVRSALVKGAMAWAKAYTETAAFKADYDRQRRDDAPEPPEDKGGADAEIAKQRAEQKKQIEEMRANLAKMPAEMRAQMADVIKQIEAQTAAMDKDPQMAAMRKQGVEMQRAEDLKAYEGRVRAHEKRFPADPRVLIARRLTEFLEMSKDVDFAAKLTPGPGGKMRFTEARYEEKPAEWKMCYRAGREPVEAARAFAADWLEGLGVK